MKKLIAIFVFSIFLVIGCQESSSIVAPDSNTKSELEKQDTEVKDSLKKDGDPIFPRP